MKREKVVINCIVGILLALLSIGNIPQISKAESKTDTVSKVEINKETIAKFINNYFNTNMERYKVPGACVAVVKDNKELFKEGYGYSNLVTKEKADPDKTTYPACSVSKLFTATAIMQLYEEGKINLYENIQKYIGKVTIHNPYKEVVNCNNLLTHSSGLDEGSELSGGTLNKNEIKSQEFYFENHIPRVAVRPNTLCQYSNIGYNLLGYVIQNVSGISYEDYIKQNILNPLQMQNSGVRVENTNMSKGYEFTGGKYQEDLFSYQYTSGSSGVITTVTDMEHFMMMHLNGGVYHGNRVLNQDTDNLMHIKQFANNDVFAGMSYGFIRSDRNGVEILKHEGALPGYTTTLLLFPEENMGIYVATNSLSGYIVTFEKEFLDYFYPQNKATPENNTVKYNAEDYVGTYRSYDGISKSNIMKIGILFEPDSDIKVTLGKNNQLILQEYTEGKEKISTSLTYVKEDIFLRGDGNGYFTFRRDEHGNIEDAFNDISYKTFQKINRFETATLLTAIIVINLLSGIIFTGFIITRAIRHKIRKDKYFYFGMVGTEQLFSIGLIGAMISALSMIMNYNYSYIWMLKLFLAMIIIGIFLLIGCIAYYVSCIIRRKFHIRQIILYGMIFFINIGFLFVMKYFNFIGFYI